MIFHNFSDMKGGNAGDCKDHGTAIATFHSDEVEVDSRTTPAPTPTSKDFKPNEPLGDGSSIEVLRRPRGRPPGSKNKPKPPVVITRTAGDSNDVMRPYVLEIADGHDVTDALLRFSRRRNVGVSVLAGTGLVSNVTLRQPAAATFTFHGRFEILSISATFLPPAFTPTAGGVSISLAGPHGQVVGGAVAGPLVAAGTVTVVAAVFTNPSFHRLPAEDDVVVSGDRAIVAAVAMESSGGASCHMLSDVIWAPMGRTHPTPY